MKAVQKAKITLLSSMALFGTIGIFVRYIPLPSSLIALVRGTVGMLFLFIIFANAVCDISVSCASLYLETLCLLHNSFTIFGMYSSVRK